jgi:FkbM family methyltransferase
VGLAEFTYTVLLKPAPLRKLANRAIRALLPEHLRFRGIQLALNPADPVASGALLFGVYENAEIRFFERYLRPGMTVVDVGANIGLYSAIAARAVGPEGRVVALEPDPESFSYLLKTLACNGFRNVEAFQVAASSAAGSARLFRNPDNRGDSRLYADDLLANPLDVRTVTLDGLLED